ncbi:MAG TPA: hypothetical protein P5081_16185 [Phycisphaerae bacterium]|nr:hypothetical protein [Phycisphaerae bacterium]HRW54410.1 hypothetical protein [Phycisphaerae bacterium]
MSGILSMACVYWVSMSANAVVSAPLESSDVAPPTLMIETRYLQVDTTRLTIAFEGYEPDVRRKTPGIPASSRMHVRAADSMRDTSAAAATFGVMGTPRPPTEDAGFECVVLPGPAELIVNEKPFDWNLLRAGTEASDAASPLDGLESLKALAAPRLLVNSGQTASFCSGRERAYLEKDGDCLRLRTTARDESDPIFGMAEGTSLEVCATLQEDGAIRFEPFVFQYRFMVGREPIEGVPLDVGRPIIRTRRMSTSLVMRQKATAVFAFPRDSEEEPLILALVQGYAVENTGAGDRSKAESTKRDAAGESGQAR